MVREQIPDRASQKLRTPIRQLQTPMKYLELYMAGLTVWYDHTPLL